MRSTNRSLAELEEYEEKQIIREVLEDIVSTAIGGASAKNSNAACAPRGGEFIERNSFH